MNTITKWGLEPRIGVEELAEYLGVPVQTIYDWRMSGKAPRALKIGKHLRFALSDVRAWLTERYEGQVRVRRRGPAMSRPRIPVGTHGAITFINRSNGRVEACC